MPVTSGILASSSIAKFTSALLLHWELNIIKLEAAVFCKQEIKFACIASESYAMQFEQSTQWF